MDISKINDNFYNATISQANEAKNKTQASNFESQLNNAFEKKDKTELKKVCNDFEGIIMNIVYKQMKLECEIEKIKRKSNSIHYF